MGAILSILKGGSNESKPIDLPIDFNGMKWARLCLKNILRQTDKDKTSNILAPATSAEVEYNNIQALTQTFPQWVKALETYTGCGDMIRQAISSPGKATEEAAWEAILPAVSKLKEIYEFAQQVESIFPKLMAFLCSDEPTVTFEKHQASAYQLATCINFAIQFDLIKMSNPSIQNDFSYYRRSVSKMKLSPAHAPLISVNDELANRMSLFFAHSSPLSKALIDVVSSNVSLRKLNATRVVDCFGILAGVSYNTIIREKTAPQGDLLYLRVMVGAVLFYDHIDPNGAFVKESSINIKSTVKIIQSHGGASTEPLINVLKFSTIHLNSETTPKATKALLA